MKVAVLMLITTFARLPLLAQQSVTALLDPPIVPVGIPVALPLDIDNTTGSPILLSRWFRVLARGPNGDSFRVGAGDGPRLGKIPDVYSDAELRIAEAEHRSFYIPLGDLLGPDRKTKT